MAKNKSLNDPTSVVNMFNSVKPTGEQIYTSFYTRMMYTILYRIALNRIEWVSLPDDMDSHLIERHLINNNTLSIYQPEYLDRPILCYAVGNGLLNNQGISSSWNLRSLNGKGVENNVPYAEVAICDPFYERTQVHSIIRYYVDLFDDFDKALKSNLRMQKTPVLVTAPDELRLTVANIVDQYENGAPTIYTYQNNGLDMGTAIQAVNFNVDYVADRILIDRRQAWNDCMTYLGINNSNQDKKERLVTDEVQGNFDQVTIAQLVDMDPRESFADKVNDLYNLNVSVEWRGESTVTDTAQDDEELYNVQSTGGRRSNINATVN